MDFFETVARRRSIRKFLPDDVPEEVMNRAFDAALLAPNSSNLQTWDFYWLRSPEKRAAATGVCLDQAAARSAREIIAVVANPDHWKRANDPMRKFVAIVNAPKAVHHYYEKQVPLLYRAGPMGIYGPFKRLLAFLLGTRRPTPRGPFSISQLQEVAIKSAALAAENFVLALSAQGFSSCMMEGFDERRAHKLLGLRGRSRVVMFIAIGRESDRGTWGPRFRIPRDEVIHIL